MVTLLVEETQALVIIWYNTSLQSVPLIGYRTSKMQGFDLTGRGLKKKCMPVGSIFF